MKNVQMIKVSDIIADENQPRRYFDAEAMATLGRSIEKHGIKVPISVQDLGNGKYLLEDGERRWRTAKELGLKEVPAIIETLTNATERLVRQFTIQEQHEGWTPVEKAVAIDRLSTELNISIQEVCKLLSVRDSLARSYAAFAEIVDKKNWVKREVPLDWAMYVRAITIAAKKVTENVLEKSFGRDEAKVLEEKITALIRTGVIVKRNDLMRLRDSFIQEPKSVEKFLEDDTATPLSLFVETKAKGAYHLRNMTNSCRWVGNHGRHFLNTKSLSLTKEHIGIVKEAKRVIDEVLALAE